MFFDCKVGLTPSPSGPTTTPRSSEYVEGGKTEDNKVEYINIFLDRKFSEISSPELLDFEGAEFILISASEDIQKELGLKMGVQTETETSADIFKDLKLDKTRKLTKPLFKGEWE